MTFKREARYLILNKQKMSEEALAGLKEYINQNNLPIEAGVVVEYDWPMYDITWRLIEEWTTLQNSTKIEFEDAYLLSNGYSDSNPLFWKKGKCGYTTDVLQAHIFTKRNAQRQCEIRDSDRMHKLSDILKNCRLVTVEG